jgi:hypothetical protein
LDSVAGIVAVAVNEGAAADGNENPPAAADGAYVPMLHPMPQELADIAGPNVWDLARWQQHLDRQHADATDVVSQSAVMGDREANHSNNATGMVAARRVQR